METGNEELKAYLGNEKLEEFLGKNKVICREERQFAALLYSAFLDEKRGRGTAYTKIIVRQCLELEEQEESITIQNVYFEATLMRDYFRAVGKKDDNNRMTKEEKDKKKKFNERLLQFCLGFLEEDCKNTTVEEIKNLLDKEKQFHHFFGQKTVKGTINKMYTVLEWMNHEGKGIEEEQKKQIQYKACLDIARMMMNATPDILVIYEMGDEKYAKALECKYESHEGRYADVAGVNVKMQYFIQECVMSFLFGKIENTDDTEKAKNHLPKFPDPENRSSSAWKGNEDLGKEIYGQVYNNILNQEWGNEEIKNKGIAVIRFWEGKEGEQEENSSEILIEIKELLKNMYTFKKSDNNK